MQRFPRISRRSDSRCVVETRVAAVRLELRGRFHEQQTLRMQRLLEAYRLPAISRSFQTPRILQSLAAESETFSLSPVTRHCR